ncbi:hypothetical protein LCGC14_0942190 [marine sediment metagenome]|uniref:Uncharacterized protein n=1 Tax=marine sediment metagenome TaxID=412755 RepID=A0A0F9NJT7_9ZZZZ
MISMSRYKLRKLLKVLARENQAEGMRAYLALKMQQRRN